MRVFMGEVIDVNEDLTTKHLTLQQKVAVLWQTWVADSKILGNRKKAEADRLLRERSERVDRLRDGLLASIEYHLTLNKTLEDFNEEARIVQLALERKNLDILPEVLASHEFNSYEVEEVVLDRDLVVSFGEAVPIIIAFSQKEVL